MEDLSKIRNIGVAAHIDAGKTTTTERLLFYAGAVHKMGDVDDGTTVTDFDVEEQQRGITIYSAAVSFQWRDCRVNLIDTPGHVDFTAEVERSLRVLDGAIVVFDVKEGVEAQSETVWRQADKYHVPRICFMNKMDKVGADFEHALESVRERLHSNPVPIQIPIGSEGTFRGLIDLIEMKAVIFSAKPDRTPSSVEEIPADMLEAAKAARHVLEEKASEYDDALMQKYLDGQPLGSDEIKAALRKGTIARLCQPVLCGSSLRFMGVRRLLDAVCDFLPSPLEVPPVEAHDPKNPEKTVLRKCSPDEPLSALVFKVVADSHSDLQFIRVYSGVLKAGSRVLNVGRNKKENVPRLFRIFAKRRDQVDAAYCGDIVAAIGLKDTLTGDTLTETHSPVLLERIDFPETVISMAIEPESSADKDKLAAALQMLGRSDPTFNYRIDTETGQTLISGMGELHLETRCNYLKREMGVPVRVGKPRVAYRETITVPAEAEGRVHRQIGAKSQFAVVKVRVEPHTPLPGQEHLIYSNRLPEGRVKSNFLSAIEAGARGAAQTGALGGYPLINLRVLIIDAQENADESTEVAFESAASMAVQKAVEAAGPVLLEPIMKVEVVTPDDYFGAINGDLMSRRAVITETSMRGKNQVIHAEAPLASMFGYSTNCRSLSQGRASYSMEFGRYEAMPGDLAKKVLGT